MHVTIDITPDGSGEREYERALFRVMCALSGSYEWVVTTHRLNLGWRYYPNATVTTPTKSRRN